MNKGVEVPSISGKIAGVLFFNWKFPVKISGDFFR